MVRYFFELQYIEGNSALVKFHLISIDVQLQRIAGDLALARAVVPPPRLRAR